VDLIAVGRRIRMAREANNLTQEDLAELMDMSPTHISVIERGQKAPRLDTFVLLANILKVSADSLLVDVVDHSVEGVSNELYEQMKNLPREEQKRIINAVRVLTDR